MDDFAKYMGYLFMALGTPMSMAVVLYGMYSLLVWLVDKVPPLRGALLHQLQLGRKAYLALPKDQRKGWPKE